MDQLGAAAPHFPEGLQMPAPVGDLSPNTPSHHMHICDECKCGTYLFHCLGGCGERYCANCRCVFGYG